MSGPTPEEPSEISGRRLVVVLVAGVLLLTFIALVLVLQRAA